MLSITKRISLGAGILVATITVAACTTSSAPQATTTSTNATLTELVSTLGNGIYNPRDEQSGPAGEGYLIFASLLTEVHGRLEPGLASSWQSSPDSKTWTFHVRSGAKFQNGAPVTASDVAFSLQYTFGPGNFTDRNSVSSTVTVAHFLKSVKVTGPDTVQVNFNTGVPYFGAYVSDQPIGGVAGGIFPKAYFQKVGAAAFDRAPIGAGPFKLVSSNANQGLTLERFDGYYDKAELPKFKELKVDVVPNLNTRVEALLGNTADIIQADSQVASQITSAGFKTVLSPYSNYVWDQWQSCWKPHLVCHSQQVREALDLALNTPVNMKALYSSAWDDGGWQLSQPGALGYVPSLKPVQQDAAKARQLLAAAGYPNGKGFPTITINVVGDDAAIPELPNFALLVQQQWKQVLGVSSKVNVAPFATLDGHQGTGALDGSFYIRDNQARYDGASLLTSEYGGDTSNPSALAKDPTLTTLVNNMNAASSLASQGSAMSTLYRAAAASYYEYAFGGIANVWGVSSRVTGWKPFASNSFASALWTIRVH